MSRIDSFRAFPSLFVVVLSLIPVWALTAQTSGAAPSSPGQQQTDPFKRPLTEKQRTKQAEQLRKELGRVYTKWRDEDVRWIITSEELQAFNQLSTDEERDAFIEQFWLRRDPSPDTEENEVKEEHYRRITYANEHFASGVPGWKTDRGRIYIVFGPPAEVESHPAGGSYERTPQEGGGTTTTFPFERWRYRHIDGIGDDINIEFVDQCSCGQYQMEMDLQKKDALLFVPGAGPTLAEQLGQDTKANRITRGGLDENKKFDELWKFAALNAPPAIGAARDPLEDVKHIIRYNVMPFEVRADFLRVTGDTDLVPITIQIKNSDITFNSKDGVAVGVVNVFGRVTNITGRVVQTFEDTVQRQEPAELLPKLLENSSVYGKALALRPGRYKLDLVLKDVNGDRVGALTRSLPVPDFSDETLATSSLILADQMERVPTKIVAGAPFVIGSTKVRPRVEPADGRPAVFKKMESVNIWMQVYNLGIDQQTRKSHASFEYDVVSLATNKVVAHMADDTGRMTNPGEQVTLEKVLPLSALAAGTYRMAITVKDAVAARTITTIARFAVE